MTPSPRSKSDDLDLDLPALDGLADDEELPGASFEDALGTDGQAEHDAGAYDDATGEDAPLEDVSLQAEGGESGWLVDAEGAGTLDVGSLDLAFGEEESLLGGDDEAPAHGAIEEVGFGDESFVADGGEEGPLAEDEELREEDLPALDADGEGDVPDELLFDPGALAAGEALAEELRWADRAWERVAELGDDASAELEESGLLVAPAEDGGARDAAWKRLDRGGRVTAAAFVPGGSVVLAMTSGDKAVLVRIVPDGDARILAEIEAADEPARVRALGWDAARGRLIAQGNFGVEAYRPA